MIYALLGIAAAFCAFIQWGDEIPMPHGDLNKKEAKYVHNVHKQEEKDKFEKVKLDRNPSGYMTVEEYELLSTPKDRMTMEITPPKTPIPSDMVYVPQPSYKIVKYNNPPGSPEISIDKSIYTRRQQNAQGIVSPDFTRLVYPAIYYYPNSGSVACDLFVINLEEAKSNMDKILTANIIHRLSDPILSTEKNNENYYTFRTLTPVDFSSDGTKLLVKEKIGNTKDGIWQTTPVVYDFSTGVSYDLVEIREAIVYYWKSINSVNLNDKRWDVIPLGFDAKNSNNVIVKALAYTGKEPVNLGVWSISAKGETPRLVSLSGRNINVSMNGYKLIKAGAVPAGVSEKEEKQLKQIDKANAKQKKREDKAEIKELEKSYKTKIKEMDTEFKESQKDYRLRQRINGSTSGNDAVEKYNEIKKQMEEKRQLELQKQKEKAKESM